MSQSGIISTAEGPPPPDVPITFVCNVGTATASANILDVLGGTGAQTVGVGNVITINTVTTGFIWNVVTSVSPANPIQLVKQNGYICNGNSQVQFILPLAPAIGDSFIVISNTATFQIIENGFQQMGVGFATSTVGSGNATSNVLGDYVEFVYLGVTDGVAIFRSFSPQGTITVY